MKSTTTATAASGEDANDAGPVPRLWIVAHDFSPCADDAADIALDDLLDSREGGALLLVHAFDSPLPPSFVEPTPASDYVVTVDAETRAAVTHRLERVADRLRCRQRAMFTGPLPVEIEVVARSGPPADVVLAETKARGGSRIIVGTHGRRGLSRFLLGSVAERIARTATVPVFVAHARKRAHTLDPRDALAAMTTTAAVPR